MPDTSSSQPQLPSVRHASPATSKFARRHSSRERICLYRWVRCLQKKTDNSPASGLLVQRCATMIAATHIDQTLQITIQAHFWAGTAISGRNKHFATNVATKAHNPTESAESGMERSPVWDGSKASMSGNGAHQLRPASRSSSGGNGLPEIYFPTGMEAAASEARSLCQWRL